MSAQSTARRGTAFRALVVDDEAAIRLLCRVNLEASGMQVIEASDGAAGLDAAEEHEPDVVLLDVMMPALNGWDVARELSERGSRTPIIFLTALADPSARVKAYEHGGGRLHPEALRPGGSGRVRRDGDGTHRARRARRPPAGHPGERESIGGGPR